jgi:diguanylate cyclase (GGDEF)-like protein/PAS domain S-box-containing protein
MPPRNVSILLVDDSEDDFLMTKIKLAQVAGWECKVSWVANYQAAVEAIRCAEHDIYLLDYHLGKRNGIELLREVTAFGSKGPFIILTAEDDHQVDFEAMKAGASDYLMKGEITPRLLERTIRYALERAHVMRMLNQSLEALHKSEERYALAVQASNDGLWDWNMIADTIYYSERWKSMLGYDEHEIGDLVGEWFERIHPDDHPRLQAELAAHLEGLVPHIEIEYRIRHRDESYRWVLCRGLALRDPEGKPFRMAGSHSDITRRKKLEEQLVHDALYDALTGVPNRSFFLDQLRRTMTHSRRVEGYTFAVLFLDLNGFKPINDTLGHLIGDQLLVAVARRLETCLRANDSVARLGGDEFVILLREFNDRADIVGVMGRIQEHLAAPMNLSGHEVTVSASIGVAFSDDGYDRPEDILRAADEEMYRAKAEMKADHKVIHERV